MTPPVRSVSVSARADLPLAVGPAIRATGGFGRGPMAIATLIAAGRLDDRLVDRALGLLREFDPQASFGHWIDEGDAADLRFTGDLKSARWALQALPDVDFVVQPDEPRWKRLLVADMDSTIIGQECIDELADYAGPGGGRGRLIEGAWARRFALGAGRGEGGMVPGQRYLTAEQRWPLSGVHVAL